MARRPTQVLNTPKLPPSPLMLIIGWVLVMLGFAQGMFDFLPEAREPVDPDALVTEGYRQYEEGRYDSALATFRRATVAAGESAVILVGMGRAYLGIDNLDAAEDHLVRGILSRERELLDALESLESLRDDLLARAAEGEDTAEALAATDRLRGVLAVWPERDQLLAVAYTDLAVVCRRRAQQPTRSALGPLDDAPDAIGRSLLGTESKPLRVADALPQSASWRRLMESNVESEGPRFDDPSNATRDEAAGARRRPAPRPDLTSDPNTHHARGSVSEKGDAASDTKASDRPVPPDLGAVYRAQARWCDALAERWRGPEPD